MTTPSSKKTTASSAAPPKKNNRLVKGSPEAFARMKHLRTIRDAKKKQKEEEEEKYRNDTAWQNGSD